MPMNRVDPSSERGVAMIVVMMVLIAGTALATAALAAAGADMPFARESQDRKQAFAAAEAGTEYYLYQLSQDNDFWLNCDNVPAPNATELNPVNQQWVNPAAGGADPRRWRKVPGADAEYTIELLPAAGQPRCVEDDGGRSMLDPSSGAFRIRSSGRENGIVRSTVTTLRRRGFLDFIYFTNFETTDPAAYDPEDRAAAEQYCAFMRAQRNRAPAGQPPGGCVRIQFRGNDSINGPFHTNDDILTCGATTFGRSPSDLIEISGPAPGWDDVCSGGSPNFKGTLVSGAETIDIPPTSSDSELAAAALPAYRYTGKTTIRLNGGSMNVTTGPSQTTTNNVPLPPNGVVYVTNGACSGTMSPAQAQYTEALGCGNLYVSGTYSKSMTFASTNDIIVTGDLKKTSGSDHVFGLIAENFVRVYHPVARAPGACVNLPGTMQDVTIEAAILSLRHSFIVDNHDCGSALDNLTVTGAIAQRYRGVVGTSGGFLGQTGYLKDYNFDDRLRFRSPPFFLNPVSAAWKVIRTNEQVPATKERTP